VKSMLCQRQIALRQPEGDVVILTLTADRRHAKQVALTLPVSSDG
jgi:hypothetical protein